MTARRCSSTNFERGLPLWVKATDVPAPDPRLIDAQIKSLGIQDQAIQYMIDASKDMAPQQRQMMQDSIDRSRQLWQQSQEDRQFALGKRAQLAGIRTPSCGMPMRSTPRIDAPSWLVRRWAT